MDPNSSQGSRSHSAPAAPAFSLWDSQWFRELWVPPQYHWASRLSPASLLSGNPSSGLFLTTCCQIREILKPCQSLKEDRKWRKDEKMWIQGGGSILQEYVLEVGSGEERQSGLSLHRLQSRNSTGWDGRKNRAKDQRDSNVFRVDVQGSLRFTIYFYQAVCLIIVYLLTEIYSFHVSVTLWNKCYSYHYSSFTEEETKAQDRHVICPEMHS